MVSTIPNITPIIHQHRVEGNYEAYTAEDHETWRIATSKLHDTLEGRCCIPYKKSFENVGLTTTRIPKLTEINKSLAKHQWSSILIDSFIPPQHFMNLHANSVIPVTRQVRTRAQLEYTPIPDIVHEAAGHLPMLSDPDYRKFLRRLGEIGSIAEYTQLDREVYEQHKSLAELLGTDDPDQQEVNSQSDRLSNLKAIQTTMTSKASLIARFHWWTVEYGLTGKDHKIYGAGLLSSVGEAASIDGVPHETLSLDCLDLDFDITKPQPVLFVAKSLNHLNNVLTQLEDELRKKRDQSA